MATVGLLHPGEMGAAVGGCLVSVGHEVLWDPAGRSRATTGRALASELTGVGFDRVIAKSSAIFSICPPHAALDVARQVADTGYSGLYIDANAISVATAEQVAAIVTAGGATYVDGGIIGPPPEVAGHTRFYLSGPHANEVRPLFSRRAHPASRVAALPARPHRPVGALSQRGGEQGLALDRRNGGNRRLHERGRPPRRLPRGGRRPLRPRLQSRRPHGPQNSDHGKGNPRRDHVRPVVKPVADAPPDTQVAHGATRILPKRHSRPESFYPCGTQGHTYWPYVPHAQNHSAHACHRARTTTP